MAAHAQSLDELADHGMLRIAAAVGAAASAPEARRTFLSIEMVQAAAGAIVGVGVGVGVGVAEATTAAKKVSCRMY